jgi:arabinogalactan oligomer/maltooligosaccharide transport system substrate-binding protein
VNIKDFQRLLRHVNKINPLSGYALACGDVTGDGQVNIKDFQRLLRHVNKTNPLYPDQKDVTIKVWVPSEDLMEGYSWLEEMQRRFEAKHPEYCIFWINEAMSAGDVIAPILDNPSAAADVYMYAHDQQFKMIWAGGLAQLADEYAQQVRDDNAQLAIDSVTHTDGEIYGLPMEGNTWILYYNKQVFTEEDVKNLDVMLEKGRVCLPYNTAWNAGAFFLGCGGTLFGEHGRDAEAGIDFSGDNGGYMAAKKMIELAQHPNAVLGGMDAYRLITGEADAIFSGGWDFESLKQALGDDLGIAMLPKFTIDGEEYQMTAMSGTKCVGVNDYVDNSDGKKDLCMEFAAFLASEEGQLLRYEMRGVTPIHVNLMKKKALWPTIWPWLRSTPWPMPPSCSLILMR